MINLRQARRVVALAVRKKGRDFVYAKAGQSCYNIPRPDLFGPEDPRATCACIVGTALDFTEETRHHDHQSTAVSALATTYPDMMTDPAMRYLRTAQGLQDTGSTWGESHDAAEALVKSGEITEPYIRPRKRSI